MQDGTNAGDPDSAARTPEGPEGQTPRVRDEFGDEVDALVPGWEGVLPADVIACLELGKRISRLDQLLQQALKVELAELGLSYAEFDVLAALHRRGAPYRLRPSELTRSLWLTSGGTSNLLHRLEGAGYIERPINEADSRSRFVQLTDPGVATARAALQASSRAHERLLGSLPADAVRGAADSLRRILVGVRNVPPGARGMPGA